MEFKKCNKIFFVLRKHAKHYVKGFKLRGDKTKFRVYKCNECDGYHFTRCDAEQVRVIREGIQKDNW